MKKIAWKPVLRYAFFWSLGLGAAIEIMLSGLPEEAGGNEAFIAFGLGLLGKTALVFPLGIGVGIFIRKSKEWREAVVEKK